MKEVLRNQIIEKAKEFGACAAGIADVEVLKQSPSHLIYPQIGGYNSFLNKEVPRDAGEVLWPQYAKSAIVVAVEHPEDKPQLDWWQDGLKGGTPGNQVLITIISCLSEWLRKEKGYEVRELPYYIVQGGIFLKDAAVMAGLGCIGKNNMLVTPACGPRVRLRAALLNMKLPATGPSDFDPCAACDMPCRKACPQEAFQNKIRINRSHLKNRILVQGRGGAEFQTGGILEYFENLKRGTNKEIRPKDIFEIASNPLGLNALPGRTGVYSRRLCKDQMELDTENGNRAANENKHGSIRIVKCCRLCETSCPIGKK